MACITANAKKHPVSVNNSKSTFVNVAMRATMTMLTNATRDIPVEGRISGQ